MDMTRERSGQHPITYLIITRPGNLAITAASVFIAGIISSAQWAAFAGDLAIAALSAAFIAAGGNAFNDYCDRELDLVQKPHRPLPAGKMTPRSALLWSWICFLIGIALSTLIGISALFVASVATLVLIFYSLYWKRWPLIGNVAVAFVAALTFIYGGVAVRSIGAAFWAAWLAFFFHLGREIVKDLEDYSGDAAAGANTFVVRYGPAAGRYMASLTFMLLTVSLPLPYLFGRYKIGYLAIVLIGVLPVFIAATVLIWRWSRPEQLHRLSSLLKWDMLVGLFALYIGRSTMTLVSG